MKKWLVILFLYLGTGFYAGAQNNSMSIDFERPLKGEQPNVAYVHQEEATVVINIWVDAEGTINKTEIDASNTTTLEYNLLNWCRKFVYRLRFQPSDDKKYRPTRKGTVTLYFKP